MSYSIIQIWCMAIRPKTLVAAVAPVMLGTAMALGDGIHHFPTAALALIGALAVQITTNLVNDYYDHVKGADTAERIGPTRIMQAGLVSAAAMKTAICLALTVAIVTGYFLIERGGMPLLIIVLASVFCAFFYTAGPFPLGYLGLGELLVLIFFGPVAVAGTYFVQSYEMNPATILSGLGTGFLAAAVLVVNNIRDHDTDSRAGKKTLVVRFGRAFGYAEFLFFILAASLVPLVTFLVTEDHPLTLFASTIGLWAIPLIITVLQATDGPAFNSALAGTARLIAVYSILFSLGWLL